MGILSRIKNRHRHHCELSSYAEGFSVTALIAGLYMTFYTNQPIVGENIAVLFGFAAAGGLVALIWYRVANGKRMLPW